MVKILRVYRHDEPHLINVQSYIEEDWDNQYPLVLMHRKVLLDIYQHARGEMQHEVGGYLLGIPAEDVRASQTVVYVSRTVRGIYQSSATHVTLAAQSMTVVEKERVQDHTLLVGWYHSHPRLGIFYSGTDISNHQKHHPEKYQIGIVVDPSRIRDARDVFSPKNEWIGIWGWTKDGEVEKIPHQNIRVLDTAPHFEKKSSEETRENVSMLQVLGEELWNGFHLLGIEGTKSFAQGFPIVIIQHSIVERARQPSRGEGILLGYIAHIGRGLEIFVVIDILPCPYKQWKQVARRKDLKGMRRFSALGGYKTLKMNEKRPSWWEEFRISRYLRQTFEQRPILGHFGSQYTFYIALWSSLKPLPKENIVFVGKRR